MGRKGFYQPPTRVEPVKTALERLRELCHRLRGIDTDAYHGIGQLEALEKKVELLTEMFEVLIDDLS